jgi:polysaccharide biosynthesis transport protein
MELMRYLRLFLKWSWLFILAAGMGGGISYLTSSDPVRFYVAETRLSIGRTWQNPNPDRNAIGLGETLAATYEEIIRTESLLEATVEALDLSLSPGVLRDKITTYTIEGTSIMVISVVDNDSKLAAQIADGLAEQLIAASPTNPSESELRQIAVANENIEALQDQLKDTRERVALIEELLVSTRDPDEITRFTLQRNLLIDQINSAAANVAQFSSSIIDLQNRLQLEILEYARVWRSSVGPGRVVSAVLGGFVGIILAIVGMFVLEYLNDSIKTSDEAVKLLDLPLLGTIGKFGRRKASYDELLVAKNPKLARQAESFRSLRTNLLYDANHGGKKQKAVYVVTSAGPGEGKSVVAANLAASAALSGLRVLLIDADMYNPTAHKIFGLRNDIGLATLVSSYTEVANSDSEEASVATLPQNLTKCFQETTIPGLWVITSGLLRSNLVDRLGSIHMRKWVETFLKLHYIVIIDTPPALVVSDSVVVSAGTDAEVILVIDSGNTRRDAAIKAKEKFTHLDVTIRGLVVNRVGANQDRYLYKVPKNYYMNEDGSRNVSSKGNGKESLAEMLPNAGLVYETKPSRR